MLQFSDDYHIRVT